MTCGILFGLTSPLIGHPIDSLKTQMQAGKASYLHGSSWRTLVTLVKTEGPLALYRGLLPPLMGSSIFRSVQFSAYGMAMGHLRDSPAALTEIPGSGGMQFRVLASGVFASSCRALIETPLEYVKVRRQTGQSWMSAPSVGEALRNPLKEIANMYQGFSVSWARTVGLMTLFFIQVDHLERHHHDLITTPLIGPFIKGGVCATVGWILVWPLEVMKNRMQANTEKLGPEVGWVTRAHAVLRADGVTGLFRGIGPGVTRSLVANGSSMIVYSKCQEMMRGH